LNVAATGTLTVAQNMPDFTVSNFARVMCRQRHIATKESKCAIFKKGPALFLALEISPCPWPQRRNAKSGFRQRKPRKDFWLICGTIPGELIPALNDAPLWGYRFALSVYQFGKKE
jgi:hypothetical protein